MVSGEGLFSGGDIGRTITPEKSCFNVKRRSRGKEADFKNVRDSPRRVLQIPQIELQRALRKSLAAVTFPAMPENPERTSYATAPLLLLLRVNALQAWRRLLSVREQSRLLTGLIALFIVGYLVLSFWLFYHGMKFLAKFPGLGVVLTERLMYVLFAFLFALLLLSNLIISYTNLFRNSETAFLTTLPVSTRTIFQWKFIESALLASWAFLFLVAPLLAAFGLVRGAPWHFYPLTVLLIGLFIVLPGVLGAALAIAVGRLLDRRSFQTAVVATAMVLLALAAFWWRAQAATDDLLDKRTLQALDQLLARTRFTMFPFLPSYWLSAAVLQWAEGVLRGAAFFALVLLSHALFFGSIAFTRCGELFYGTASAVQSRAGVRGRWHWLRAARGKQNAIGPLEKTFAKFFWLDRASRALAVKDLRMFWRDTTQWGQSAMLFGLLGAYIINLRNFTHQLTSEFWINLIAFLNLFACSLNLATVTTRFVFPQFSLEGQRLWIVGMAPMGLARVVKTKYWLASTISLLVTFGLVTLSCYLLKMSWERLAFFGAVVTVVTLALNGLAVGLGVLYPNFKDANPTKIVSGFGGTLCLVLSSFYIIASVLLLGFGTSGLHAHAGWAMGSVTVFLLLSLLIGWLPLRWGLQRLDNLEI
jgi:ABC-2 type transport system permease protein